jgi:transposase
MHREITSNHNQGFLLPPYLDDLIPKNHPARFIDEFVNELNLDQLEIEYPTSEQGGIVYDPKLLLKVWLYCLCDNIRSLRKIEKACYKDIGLLWLTSLNYPDHSTLWRFWVNNKKAVKKLFTKTVLTAQSLGLIGAVLNAVDGTKLLSQASKHNILRRKDLEKLLAKLETEIEKIGTEIDQNAENDIEPVYALPEDLQDKKVLRDSISASLQYLDEIERDYMQPKDPDSRMMRMNDNQKKFGYSGQVVVDEQNGIIAAADVTQDEYDNHMLVPMLEQVKENIGQTAEETLADGGYFSGQQFQQAEELGHSVLVNIKGGEGHQSAHDGYPKELFTHDKKRDVVICPHGQSLTFVGETRSKNDTYNYRVYRCHHNNCLFNHLCTQDKKGRRIKLNPYADAILRQKVKQSNELKQSLLKKRKTIVEPVFGIIKHNNGFRRFSRCGLDNVKAEWLWICVAFNLKKIYQYWVFC